MRTALVTLAVVVMCALAGLAHVHATRVDVSRAVFGRPSQTLAPTLTPIATLLQTPTSASTSTDMLFSDGWDRSTTLDCNDDSILDAGAWDAAGGANMCPSNEAGIDTTTVLDGTRSLRVTQYPGRQNGTDVRVVKTFGSQPDVTLIAWLRYAPNYRWARGDHKVFIFTDALQSEQNVYLNYRSGSDPQHARVCVGVTTVDTIYCASKPQVTVNTWYRLRVYVKGGSAGTVQVWLQPKGQAEVPLKLEYDAGTTVKWASFNTGALGGFKIDTTYNIGGFITEPMNQWYDAIALYRGLSTGP